MVKQMLKIQQAAFLILKENEEISTRVMDYLKKILFCASYHEIEI
jgi:hypothetical protein